LKFIDKKKKKSQSLTIRKFAQLIMYNMINKFNTWSMMLFHGISALI